MKALLVVDVDEKHMLLESNDLYDRMKGRKCTLVPMPKKHDNVPKEEYELGWNDCIEEIENG